MKNFILIFLFLNISVTFADELFNSTEAWLESHTELSHVGLPASPQVRREFKQLLDLHINELSRKRAEFAVFGKTDWLKWYDSKALDKVSSFMQYHDHLGQLLKLVLNRPALVGIMNESQKEEDSVALRLWSLLEEWNDQSVRSKSTDGQHARSTSLKDFLSPTMSDFYHLKSILLKEYKRRNLSYKEIEIFLKSYNERQKSITALIKKNVPPKLWNHYLYSVKSSLLTFFGRFALPARNTIDAKKMKTLNTKLAPGDLIVVNQDGRLSNVLFTGTWSHGILYASSPDEFTAYFRNDLDTNMYYAKKCLSRNLACSDFESYLREFYPDQTEEYFSSRNDESPKVIIEAIDKGVITNSFETMKKVNRLAAFSPKLSKLERARAIEIAFSNIGKPYDYNFDARSYDKLVCTELILYAYLPEPETDKKGLDFIVSVVRGIPAMYAYNIVEAFFEKDELEFKAYWESPREADYLEERTKEQLAETI